MDTAKKYIHGEAFCLMRYNCKKCGGSEFLWNSRDGVTPFMIGSSCCPGATSAHENFSEDRPFSEMPSVVNRVFVDMTMDKAKEYAQRFWDRNGESMLAEYEHLREIGKEKLMQAKIEECFGDGTRPDVISSIEFTEHATQH